MDGRSRLGLMRLVSALAACGSRPPFAGMLEPADAGLEPEGGASVADASADAVTCLVDTDCVATGVSRPVASAGDCYCPDPCVGEVIDKATAATLARQWEDHCRMLPEFTQYCPFVICPPIPQAICVEGRCWR